MILDIEDFKNEIYIASCASLKAIWADCGHEHPYSFALMTSPLFGYIFPNADTEECLLDEAKRAATESKGFHGRLDMALKYLRWHPNRRWRFFCQNDDNFAGINRKLQAIYDQDALGVLSEAEFDATTARLEDALMDVLLQLRVKGQLGAQPDDFYLNITYGDQTFDHLHRLASRVNSPAVSGRMEGDLVDLLEFWK